MALLLAGALGAAPARPPATGAPGPARLAPPETRASGYRIVVERIAQNLTLNLEFDAAQGATVAAPKGRQMLYLALAVYPPRPTDAPRIAGVGPQIVAYTGENEAVPMRAWAEETGAATAGVWRTMIGAQELGLGVSRIERVEGTLIVYPRAQRALVEIPLPAAPGTARTAEGLRVALKQLRRRQEMLTAIVEITWERSLNISRLNPEAPAGIVFLTRAGGILIPSGGGQPVERGNLVGQQLTVTLTDLREMPARLRVEALVRSGTPQRIPFRLPGLPLPDTVDLESAAAPDPGPETLPEEHPFYAEAGGALSFPVRGAGEGVLVVGLCRREDAGFGPWRWVETRPDGGRTTTLARLRPGRYRVARIWRPARPGSPAVRAPEAEVDIEAGKTTTLPPLTIGGRP